MIELERLSGLVILDAGKIEALPLSMVADVLGADGTDPKGPHQVDQPTKPKKRIDGFDVERLGKVGFPWSVFQIGG